MNIVTIKAKAQAKAQLAAMKICSSRNDMARTAEIIESCFTPDSANEAKMPISHEAKIKKLLEILEELRDAVNKEYPNISERTIAASNNATNLINKYK